MEAHRQGGAGGSYARQAAARPSEPEWDPAWGLGMIRSTAVVVLFSLAAITLLVANLAVWAERTVFNTDQFVSTTTNVLDTPEVRQHAAENLANQLIARSDLDARLQTQLAPGLGFLVQPLTDATHQTLTTVILRALDRTLTPDREDRILTALHTQVTDVLQGRTAVQSNGDEVYIDLHDVLVSAASDIGLSQSTTQSAVNGSTSRPTRAVSSYQVIRGGSIRSLGSRGTTEPSD